MHSVLLAMKRRVAGMKEPEADADAAFRAAYPAYETTRVIDDLRRTEYRRFDEQGHTYLDYTGGGVYAESQLQAHAELLSRGIFGNPHSGNPASLSMTAWSNRRAEPYWSFSTHRATSTSPSSRPMPAARSSSSARHTRSPEAGATCSASTTTTQSTGFASSLAALARTSPTRPSLRPTCDWMSSGWFSCWTSR